MTDPARRDQARLIRERPHLRPGGVLLLYHSSFRFVDTLVAPGYTPLLVDAPLDASLSQRCDRKNQPILEPRAERYALYRKAAPVHLSGADQ
jgi:hypothetical protein